MKERTAMVWWRERREPYKWGPPEDYEKCQKLFEVRKFWNILYKQGLALWSRQPSFNGREHQLLPLSLSALLRNQARSLHPQDQSSPAEKQVWCDCVFLLIKALPQIVMIRRPTRQWKYRAGSGVTLETK